MPKVDVLISNRSSNLSVWALVSTSDRAAGRKLFTARWTSFKFAMKTSSLIVFNCSFLNNGAECAIWLEKVIRLFEGALLDGLNVVSNLDVDQYQFQDILLVLINEVVFHEVWFSDHNKLFLLDVEIELIQFWKHLIWFYLNWASDISIWDQYLIVF